MVPFVHLTLTDARRVPWKNGRGVTEELAIGPAGATFAAGDFAWRVSRAAVVEAGPFSTFPGIDRVLVVTEGAGLVLVHGRGRPTTLGPRVPHAFRGDEPTTATLVAGPVRDFNVLTRRGVCAAAEVEVLPLGPTPRAVTWSPGVALLHVVGGDGVARAADGAATTLAPGDSLCAPDLRDPTTLLVGGADAAYAIVVRIATAGGPRR